MRKTIILASLALLTFASPSMAASWNGKPHNYHNYGKLTKFERIMISVSKFRLEQLKRRARVDGRVTRYERIQIRRAQNQHDALVRKAWRS